MEEDELDIPEESNEQQDTPESEPTENNENEAQASQPSPNQGPSSIFSSAVNLWKRMPGTFKIVCLKVAGGIVLILVLVLLVRLLAAAPTAITEWFSDAGESIATFGEKLGNFFTGQGYVTDEEKAENAEKKYYNSLEVISKYYKEYFGIQIDTTMITATLFYNRDMSDYLEDSEATDIEENEDAEPKEEDSPSTSEIYERTADFYKLARRHIKTLARFQIVENTSFNTCDSSISSPKNKTVPETAKKVAETWTGFKSWNTRSTFDYRPYEYKPFSKIDGSARDIRWCEFEDAESQLQGAYDEDYLIYKDAANKYNECVATCEANDGKEKIDPDTGKKIIQSCDPASNCSKEEDSKEQYLASLKTSWGDVFQIGDDPDGSESFSCSSSSTWGALTDYNNNNEVDPSSTDRNYEFPKEWYDMEAEPGFWPSTLSWFSGGYNAFDCSAKPSIQTNFDVDLSYEGVYYYKLLTPHESLGNLSFIELFYINELPENEEERQEAAIEIVDEIFSLYDFIAERESTYCYTPSSSSGGSYSSPDRAEFISKIADEVVKDMQNTGILASLTIAQAAHESANGNSKLSQPPYNNYYGMTAGSCAKGVDKSIKGPIPPGTNGNSCSGNAYWNGTIVRMCNKSGEDCQWYRVYDGFSNSTLDHSRLLSTTRYSCQGITNSAQAINCIQNAGYATDPNYFNAIMTTINTYNLEQYNIGEWSGTPVSDVGNTLLGTVCYGNPNGSGIIYGEGTIGGSGAQGIRTHLWGTSEYATYWGSNNNLFYRSSLSLVKECTWYSHGRGLEILTKNGMSLETAQKYMDPMHGNAGLWFGQNQYFSSSTDYTKPKVGAIIVWSKGSEPGHVAIVEDIKYDSSGNIVSISTSEGGQSIDGFRFTPERTLDWVKAHGAYRFVGYVYLLD